MQEMTPSAYDFKKAITDIIDAVGKYYPDFGEKEENRIREAFAYGRKYFKGHCRKNGDPYFSHATETTKILLAIEPDIDTIIACFLYNILRDSLQKSDEIEQKFGKDVLYICKCMKDISQMQLLKENHHERQFENIQKLLIVISRDIRVLFLKLAARIHNLQTIGCLPKKIQEAMANEACEIFAPVAGRLGLYEFKAQLEDLCFEQLYPQYFKTLKREITDIRKEQRRSWEQAERELFEILKTSDVKVIKVLGRQKHYYSIYKKMKRKNFTSCSEVYDLFGFRILVPKVEDCYQALGVLHAKWSPLSERFKDYISVPKPNGYQSLHTTILGLANNKFPMEIQIRTPKMDSDAERGPASHWAYKKAGHSSFDKNYLQRMQWLPNTEENTNSRDAMFQEISESMLSDRIYVFTPKGDVETLVAGSTPVDFAYAVHSSVGDSCVGARINGTIKPLYYQLKSREIVEILTKKGRQPNPAWLDFVKSSKAKERIRTFVNKHREAMLTAKDEKSIPERTPKPIPMKKSVRRVGQPQEIIIGEERNMPFRIPSCCKPRPGQSVVAYKSRGLFFTIHKTNCAQCKRLDPDRFFEAYFVMTKKIELKGVDSVGFSRDCTAVIASHGLNIGDLSSRNSIDKENRKIVTWKCSLEIRSTEEFQKAMQDLQKVRNVLSVKERK